MIAETKIRFKSDQTYGESAILSWFLTLAFIFAGLVTFLGVYSISVVAHADNFTDIFYTNSFRGAFEWIQKLDWIGMIVQIVISVFSLVGTDTLGYPSIESTGAPESLKVLPTVKDSLCAALFVRTY